MKLKKFSPENCYTSRGGSRTNLATITFKRNGYICLSSKTMLQMGLGNKDHVLILQDEEDSENWYLQKAAADGFILTVKNGAGVVHSKFLANMFLDFFNINTDCPVRILVAGQATKVGDETYWGILTNYVKWEGKKF